MSTTRIKTHACLENSKLITSNALFTCDGCKMKGNGQRYTCDLCGDELHKECRHPKNTVSHEFFKGSELAFHERAFTKNNGKEYSKSCDICGKDICGYNYHCGRADLDIHPCCRNQKCKLVTKDGKIFELKPDAVSRKCILCEKEEISDGNIQGWSYVSTCGQYNIHVFCLTDMEHESYTKKGEMGLEKVELRKLIKYNRSRRGLFWSIKAILKVLVAVCIGDPTVIISNVLVELITCGYAIT